jgi:hypothetical protein
MLKTMLIAVVAAVGLHGPTPFMSKLVQVFFNMDKMVGKDFEDGLNNLKTLAEAS